MLKLGGVIWQLIYSFHMPLFFMISGFLTYKQFGWNSFLPYLKKKTIRLLLPWICTFFLIYWVRGSSGYWFLLCLFQISIIGFLVIKLMDTVNIKRYIVTDVAIICLVYLMFRYIDAQNWVLFGISMGRFFGAILPFFSGVLLRKYNKLFIAFINNPLFYTIGLITFILIFVTRYLVDYGMLYQIIFQRSHQVLSVLGSLLIIHAFSKGMFKRGNTLLIYLGQKTLPIYILHIIFVIQIPQIGDFILKQNPETSISFQLVFASIFSVIAILLSLVAYKFLSISRFFRRFMFGE